MRKAAVGTIFEIVQPNFTQTDGVRVEIARELRDFAVGEPCKSDDGNFIIV